MMATPQSPFQLPPHLLFPGYHASAAAAAAADAAYRQEMYKHRQSVDSAASAESLSRYTPPHALRQQQQQQSPVQTPTPEPESHPQPAASPIDVCLGADEDDSHSHSQSPHSIIHTPVAIRATPPQHQQLLVSAPASASVSPTPTHGSSSSPSHSPLSFAAKMQSLSPVSVCSIGGETGAARTAAAAAGGVAMAQDGPMDLSMKTSRSSVHSFNDSDVCSLQDEHESTMAPRRKFNQLEAEYSSSGSTTSLSSSSATATATPSFSESASVKRQKMSAGEFSGFAATSAMRGIFVCV